MRHRNISVLFKSSNTWEKFELGWFQWDCGLLHHCLLRMFRYAIHGECRIVYMKIVIKGEFKDRWLGAGWGWVWLRQRFQDDCENLWGSGRWRCSALSTHPTPGMHGKVFQAGNGDSSTRYLWSAESLLCSQVSEGFRPVAKVYSMIFSLLSWPEISTLRSAAGDSKPLDKLDRKVSAITGSKLDREEDDSRIGEAPEQRCCRPSRPWY